ncbi:MAG: cupin domain-containing protein [Bauldia sp.]
MSIAGLLDGGWKEAEFVPFRPGVEISRLAGDPAGASVALLRYAPGASVPMHEHTGLETIVVLDGAQSDDRGRYAAGAIAINPAGTRHRVWSDEGCVVLIQWERPVRILDNE